MNCETGSGDVGGLLFKTPFGARRAETLGFSDCSHEDTEFFGSRAYSCEETYRCPLRVFWERRAHWFDGAIINGLVKIPSAALGGNFVVAAQLSVRLTPQFLRALHLELFTRSSFLRRRLF
jgi:hypothetical protein